MFYVFCPYKSSFLGFNYTFCFSNFGAFLKFWGNPRNPKWRIQDGRHLISYDVITTSYDVITSRCGPHRKHLWTYHLSSKSRCHIFYTCEVMEAVKPPRPSHTAQKIKVSVQRALISKIYIGYLPTRRHSFFPIRIDLYR